MPTELAEDSGVWLAGGTPGSGGPSKPRKDAGLLPASGATLQAPSSLPPTSYLVSMELRRCDKKAHGCTFPSDER